MAPNNTNRKLDRTHGGVRGAAIPGADFRDNTSSANGKGRKRGKGKKTVPDDDQTPPTGGSVDRPSWLPEPFPKAQTPAEPAPESSSSDILATGPPVSSTAISTGLHSSLDLTAAPFDDQVTDSALANPPQQPNLTMAAIPVRQSASSLVAAVSGTTPVVADPSSTTTMPRTSSDLSSAPMTDTTQAATTTVPAFANILRSRLKVLAHKQGDLPNPPERTAQTCAESWRILR